MLGQHSAGVSGRYVRADNISMWFARIFDGASPEVRGLTKASFETTAMLIEHSVKELFQLYDIDNQSFDFKKKLTSAIRRLLPNGMANHILMTANHRAWRHCIEMRTSAHAEEEIRLVFSKIYRDISKRYPNLYQDAIVTVDKDQEDMNEEDQILEVKFANSKV